ncbi:hypothetical protein GH714_043786 [Hevea brasiliensis]|uniref:Uncharacterized protein n=1 Tax=Hevea brasiliensis TaxID=3981 RepID=A0A6A6K3M9_HEVBR|nr:hypothetical protein GH714_043786 [Hevea brasiliensis]
MDHNRAMECPTKAALNALKALQKNTRGLEEEGRGSNDRIAPSDRELHPILEKKLISALQFNKGVKRKEPTYVVIPIVKKSMEKSQPAPQILGLMSEFKNVNAESTACDPTSP